TLLKDHGSVAGIYAAIDKIEKKGLRQKLIDHRSDAELSRELVALKLDLTLPLDIEGMALPKPDVPRIVELYKELAFDRLLTQLRTLTLLGDGVGEAAGKPAAAEQGGQQGLLFGGEAAPASEPAAPGLQLNAQGSLGEAAVPADPAEPTKVIVDRAA